MKLPLLLAVFAACAVTAAPGQDTTAAPAAPSSQPAVPQVQHAYFAGGCFWCMQYAFDRVNGVTKTVVGYTGGKVAAPEYEEQLDRLSSLDRADHARQHGSFINYRESTEKQTAEASKAALDKSGKYGKPIVTEITKAGTFYPAEEEHQEYYRKNPDHFQRYEVGSGRAGYVKKMSRDE